MQFDFLITCAMLIWPVIVTVLSQVKLLLLTGPVMVSVAPLLTVIEPAPVLTDPVTVNVPSLTMMEAVEVKLPVTVIVPPALTVTVPATATAPLTVSVPVTSRFPGVEIAVR